MKKIMTLIVFIGLFLLFANGTTLAFEGASDKKCIEYRKLDESRAKTILQTFVPDAQIHYVEPGPVIGLWEVGMESGGKKGIVYIDYAGEKIVSGSIIDIKTRQNLTQKRFAELNKIDLSSIPDENSIVMGDKKAAHRIYVFSDPD
jgi:thiol:disulfide interchange protein DsbC